MFNLVFGEFGDGFFKAKGINESISSVPHHLVTDVRPKEEIYELLGIDLSDIRTIYRDLPNITLLCGLEKHYDIANSDSIEATYELARLSTLGLNFMIININNNKVITQAAQYNRVETNTDKLANLHGSPGSSYFCVPRIISLYEYRDNKGQYSTGAGAAVDQRIQIHYESLPQPMHAELYRNVSCNHTDKNKLLKLLSESLAIEVPRVMRWFINDAIAKQRKYLADNNLSSKYETLQSKVLDFFGIEDQSAIISDLRDQLTKSQQRVADHEATIESLTNALATITSIAKRTG